MRGTVHSSVALGILLSEGIGETIRVSLTDAPEKEVAVALEILRALGLRAPGPSVTSCPTCGRTKCDVKGVAEAVEAGLSGLAAEAGFSEAWSTIVDSNLTTLVAALVLFYFGTGPVRGFAVTLAIGIATSMFTSVTVTRLIITAWLNKYKPTKLPI